MEVLVAGLQVGGASIHEQTVLMTAAGSAAREERRLWGLMVVVTTKVVTEPVRKVLRNSVV